MEGTTALAGVGAAAGVAILGVWWLWSRPLKGCKCGRCKRRFTPMPQCLIYDDGAAARLEFHSGPMAGKSAPLQPRETRVGSVAGNDIVLSDPAVSKGHLCIRREGRCFRLVDEGSTNGIYLNGVRERSCILANGDMIKVGNSMAQFRLD